MTHDFINSFIVFPPNPITVRFLLGKTGDSFVTFILCSTCFKESPVPSATYFVWHTPASVACSLLLLVGSFSKTYFSTEGHTGKLAPLSCGSAPLGDVVPDYNRDGVWPVDFRIPFP